MAGCWAGAEEAGELEVRYVELLHPATFCLLVLVIFCRRHGGESEVAIPEECGGRAA